MSTTSPNPAPAESIPKPPIDPEMPAPLSMGDVMRIPMMRRLWYAQTISVFGDFLALFAVIAILTFKLHATAQQVTGVQIAYMLPIAILGILAGVFVDRWPLKPTMVASDSIRAALCLLLLFATQIWHFYAILAPSASSPASSVLRRESRFALRFRCMACDLPMHSYNKLCLACASSARLSRRSWLPMPEPRAATSSTR